MGRCAWEGDIYIYIYICFLSFSIICFKFCNFDSIFEVYNFKVSEKFHEARCVGDISSTVSTHTFQVQFHHTHFSHSFKTPPPPHRPPAAPSSLNLCLRRPDLLLYKHSLAHQETPQSVPAALGFAIICVFSSWPILA